MQAVLISIVYFFLLDVPNMILEVTEGDDKTSRISVINLAIKTLSMNCTFAIAPLAGLPNTPT